MKPVREIVAVALIAILGQGGAVADTNDLAIWRASAAKIDDVRITYWMESDPSPAMAERIRQAGGVSPSNMWTVCFGGHAKGPIILMRQGHMRRFDTGNRVTARTGSAYKVLDRDRHTASVWSDWPTSDDPQTILEMALPPAEEAGTFDAVSGQEHTFDFRKGDGKGIHRYHLDPQNGMMPTRIDYFNGPEPVFLTRFVTIHRYESRDGILIPTEGTVYGSAHGNDGLWDRESHYQATQIVTRAGLKLEDFDIEFPPGTSVSDQRAEVGRPLGKSTNEAAQRADDNENVAQLLPMPADIQCTNVTQLLSVPKCSAVVEKLDFGDIWLKADDGKTIRVGPVRPYCKLFSYIQVMAKGQKCSLPGDFETYLEQYSEETETMLTQMCARIEAEALALGSDHWAGEYECNYGPQWYRTLFVAPKGGCVFASTGCMGQHGNGLYDKNYGKATYTEGRIRLSFKYRNVREGFAGISEELILVPWAERRYLMPVDEMIKFCNNVNAGMEPRTPDSAFGHHLLHRGDDKRKVSGLPQVPEEYRRYLLAKPVEADLVTVGTYTNEETAGYDLMKAPATIDAGSATGLLSGMRLYPKLPKDAKAAHESWITLTTVGLKSSTGILTTTEESSLPPKPGQRFSTQASESELERAKHQQSMSDMQSRTGVITDRR
jgi:hypothetical protein